MGIQVIVLAAGQGKRMYSSLPKVMHTLAGKPLLAHVITTAAAVCETTPIVIFGHQGDVLRKQFTAHPVQWIEQTEQLGTGHALLQALPHIPNSDHVLVLYGDVPLITAETLKKLIDETPANAVGMVTATLADPTGYGRIKRDERGNIVDIIEEKDATEDERKITEINTGIYYLPAVYLNKWLPQLENKNKQGEYYLTDIIAYCKRDQVAIRSVSPRYQEEVFGVNDRMQLAHLERFYQYEQAKILMRQGVTLLDPHRFDLRGTVKVGRDVTIDVNVILEGNVIIGDGCIIGANSQLCNTVLGNHVEVRANSMLDGAELANDCVIGPFARLRPGTLLADKVHIGNFVEVKKSEIGEASKVNHLSYVGDSDIGKRVNVGAGTITCNYDGVNKHKTVIGDDAFIGSCTQLVAPVMVGEGATIGAGSTITHDAPKHQLTLARAQQRTVEDWVRPAKIRE